MTTKKPIIFTMPGKNGKSIELPQIITDDMIEDEKEFNRQHEKLIAKEIGVTIHEGDAWDEEPISLFLTQNDVIPERKWIIDNLLSPGDLMLLNGNPGSGKSLLAQQLCMQVSAGLPVFGKEVNAVPTLYITAEDSRDELLRRARAIRNYLKLKWHNTGDVHLMSLKGRPNKFLGTEGRRADNLKKLQVKILATSAKIVVLDLVSYFYSGNEIDRAQVTEFMEMLNLVAESMECAIIVLQHPSKAGAQEGTGQSGSTAWHGTARVQLFLSNPDGNKNQKIQLNKGNYIQGTMNAPIASVKKVYQPCGIPVLVPSDQAYSENLTLGKYAQIFINNLSRTEGRSDKDMAKRLDEFMDRKQRSDAKKQLKKKGFLRIDENGLMYRDDPWSSNDDSNVGHV